MPKLIIIPDIHGRPFWRRAVEEYPGEEFIFLGDYLDPYCNDGITAGEAFEGLRDIVALKQSRPEMITLLWGNHDLHYLYPELEGSRLDYRNAGRNRDFFKEHGNCFQIASERTVSGTRYLFTHAGVGKEWAKCLGPSLADDQITAELLNSCFPTPEFIHHLSNVSILRGGSSLFGSCIWADKKEHLRATNQLLDTVQVFGHTMVLEAFNYMNRIFCLDCQECFYLDLGKGGIYSLSKGKPIPDVMQRDHH